MVDETNHIIINEEYIDFEIAEYNKLYNEVLLPITHLFQFSSETHFVHKNELLPMIECLQQCLIMIENKKNEILSKKKQRL